MSSHYPVDVSERWVKTIEEATNGQVKITVYANSSLIDLKDTLSGLKDGIVDIAYIPTETFAENFPLHNVLTLPFLPLGTQEVQYEVWHELLNKYPELKAEWDGLTMLVDDTSTGNQLHTVKALAKTPTDMKGLRVFAGSVNADVMTDIGAVPLYLEVPDWFTSLDRGLLDGMWLPWDATWELKIYPLLPYHTTFTTGNGAMTRSIAIRNEAWNELPADLQQAILSQSPAEVDATWATLNEKAAAVQKAATEEGDTIYNLTAEEATVWYQAAKARHDAYLATVDAQGLPATAIYNEAISLAQEYSK